jgi:hypothetical protein
MPASGTRSGWSTSTVTDLGKLSPYDVAGLRLEVPCEAAWGEGARTLAEKFDIADFPTWEQLQEDRVHSAIADAAIPLLVDLRCPSIPPEEEEGDNA